jgi:hypothetical protein
MVPGSGGLGCGCMPGFSFVKFNIIADQYPYTVEPEVLEEILRRLKPRSIPRGEPVDEITAQSAATADRIASVLASRGRTMLLLDEDRVSMIRVLEEWLADVGAEKFPETARQLRDALLDDWLRSPYRPQSPYRPRKRWRRLRRLLSR